jgi:transcription initiation factor TFIIB
MITCNIDRCPICKCENSIKTDFNLGQVACTNCGAVLDDRIIDETSEWRNFSSENPGSSSSDPNRVGGPVNPYLDEVNLSTVIHTNKKNSPLSKWQHRSMGTGGRSLHRIFKRVDELAAKLDLPTSITDKSRNLLLLVEQSKKLKGRSLDCIIASVFFEACRKCNAYRTLKDIVQNLQLEKRDVNRCFNSIKTIIVDNPEVDKIPNNTRGLINLYCNKLDIPPKIRNAAYDISWEVCKKEIIAGRNPSTVATASIFYALNLFEYSKITKKDIAEISKTTENTINSAYSQLILNKDIITPHNLLELIHKLKIEVPG